MQRTATDLVWWLETRTHTAKCTTAESSSRVRDKIQVQEWGLQFYESRRSEFRGIGRELWLLQFWELVMSWHERYIIWAFFFLFKVMKNFTTLCYLSIFQHMLLTFIFQHNLNFTTLCYLSIAPRFHQQTWKNYDKTSRYAIHKTWVSVLLKQYMNWMEAI